VKGHRFVLIFSSKWEENALAVGLCALFGLAVLAVRAALKPPG